MSDDIDALDVKECFYMLCQNIDQIGEKDDKGEEIYPDLPEIYNKARYGDELKFDIYDYINGVIILKPKVGKALYRGKTINLSDLWTELEERTIIMKKWLKDNIRENFPINAYKL